MTTSSVWPTVCFDQSSYDEALAAGKHAELTKFWATTGTTPVVSLCARVDREIEREERAEQFRRWLGLAGALHNLRCLYEDTRAAEDRADKPRDAYASSERIGRWCQRVRERLMRSCPVQPEPEDLVLSGWNPDSWPPPGNHLVSMMRMKHITPSDVAGHGLARQDVEAIVAGELAIDRDAAAKLSRVLHGEDAIPNVGEFLLRLQEQHDYWAARTGRPMMRRRSSDGSR